MMNDIKKALFFVWGAAYASGIFLLNIYEIKMYISLLPVLILILVSSVAIPVFVSYWFVSNWNK